MTDDITVVDNNEERITDMPKIHSPFKRKEFIINDGERDKPQDKATPKEIQDADETAYVVYDEINDGYNWVFENDDVMAVEKLHGTNVSVIVEGGNITAVFNRTKRVTPYPSNKTHQYIAKGIMNSINRDYCELPDGQWFGELIGPQFHGNPYDLDKHYWIPFKRYAQKHLSYTSWGKYPKTFDAISDWFRDGLFSLLQCRWNGMSPSEASVSNGYFCEGIMFTHPDDDRMAKLRRDMFDWYNGRRH